jgi:hypothetical protein
VVRPPQPPHPLQGAPQQCSYQQDLAAPRQQQAMAPRQSSRLLPPGVACPQGLEEEQQQEAVAGQQAAPAAPQPLHAPRQQQAAALGAAVRCLCRSCRVVCW